MRRKKAKEIKLEDFGLTEVEMKQFEKGAKFIYGSPKPELTESDVAPDIET